MSAPAARTVLVVSHTHWDREWYETADRFRQRLVDLIDDLLDDPPVAGASFLLDGQAILLDDYLSVRPERAAEIAALLRDGRLEAGPWYVLGDELIPSGEAMVRNLLAGSETVRRLRGEAPAVLYCPDSFGHPAILPELALGFGCQIVVLWRGYGGARWPAGDTVRWRGPSGATVVLYHLPPDGYEFGSSLPTSASDAEDRWRRIAATLLPRASTSVALLLNGADHHARQRNVGAAVAALADAAHPVSVRATTLGDAARQIGDAAHAAPLPVVAGELRDSYGYAWTLGGTLATRAAQKRRNARVERALVRDVEPWIALAGVRVTGGTRALLRAAWRDLLRAHPHDTLCGTSIDAVADAFDRRLAAVDAQATGLRSDALAMLVGHHAEAARLHPDAWRPSLLLRNPVARSRGGVAEVVLRTKRADIAVGPGSASRQGTLRPGDDARIATLGMQVVSRCDRIELTESPRAYPDADLVDEVRGLVWIPHIAGYTVESRPLAHWTTTTAPRAVRVEHDTLDNELLRVRASTNGTVLLEDRATGRAVERLVGLELQRDAGDLYTPAIRDALDGFHFVSSEVTLAGPLRGEITLAFADRDGPDSLTMRLQLDAESSAVRIAVDGTNSREDVRLRIVFGTDLGSGATTIADAAFHPVARTSLTVSPEDATMETVVRSAPLHRYVSRYAERGGATLVSDGLAEYESLDDGSIAVTLLRAVGELSRCDLPERPGHAGWPASTPAAQCLGPWSARFALALHAPDSPEQSDAISRLADDVLLPITGETLRSNLLDGLVAGGLELEGAGLTFSAAMPARAPGWIVLRCVNHRPHPVQGRWRHALDISDACLSRLDETPGEALGTGDGTIDFTAAPMEIVTILARLAASDEGR